MKFAVIFLSLVFFFRFAQFFILFLPVSIKRKCKHRHFISLYFTSTWTMPLNAEKPNEREKKHRHERKGCYCGLQKCKMQNAYEFTHWIYFPKANKIAHEHDKKSHTHTHTVRLHKNTHGMNDGMNGWMDFYVRLYVNRIEMVHKTKLTSRWQFQRSATLFVTFAIFESHIQVNMQHLICERYLWRFMFFFSVLLSFTFKLNTNSIIFIYIYVYNMCIIHMHSVGKSSLSKCRCANNHRKWEFFLAF